MKKHSVIKVVLITILVMLLLTWVFPAAVFSSTYADQGRMQMGLFDLFNYPLTALSYFGYIALFVVLIGGFYGILYKIPAYRTFLDRIVAKFIGKEKVVVAIMIVFLAILTSVCGLQLGVFVFFPFLAAIILLMGYDKMTVALTLVGSVAVGLAGTTFAYNNVSGLTETLQLSPNFQIGVRVIILLAGLVILIFNTILHMNKVGKKDMKVEKVTVKKAEVKVNDLEVEAENKETVKKAETKKSTASKGTAKKSTAKKGTTKKTTKSGAKKSTRGRSANKAALKDEDIIVVKALENDDESGLVPTIVNSNHKIWPLVLGFIFLFVLMVLAFLPWASSTWNIKWFTQATEAVTGFKIFGFEIFGKLLGSVNPFGGWSITDLYTVLAIIILVNAFIYKLSFDDIIDGFMNGAKKALMPAFVVILLYSVLVLCTWHPFQLFLYKTVLGLTKGFNVFTTTVVAFFAPLFNIDAAYTFQSVVPYHMSLLTDASSKVLGLLAIVYQTMYGAAILVLPTSMILMPVLSWLGVSYKEWLGKAWKMFVELFAILLIIFIILALV